MENSQSISKSPKLKLDFKDSKYATGKRKTSIAKVWLKIGSGKIYVNGKLFNEYFSSEFHHLQITRPFEIINQPTDYDVRCNVSGGGPTGQAGAMVLGISKALSNNHSSTLVTWTIQLCSNVSVSHHSKIRNGCCARGGDDAGGDADAIMILTMLVMIRVLMG